MKVLFLGAYDDSEIVLAPIKVGRQLFKNISSKDIHTVYLCYFDDGRKYNRIQKLFGFEKIKERIFRVGIFPLLFFTIKFKPDIIQIVNADAFYLLLFPLKKLINFKVAYLTHSIISHFLKHYLNISLYQKVRFYLIEKIVYKYSDLLQMFSKTGAEFIRKYLNVNYEKIKIVDNGVEPMNLVKRYTEITDELKIISIGSLNRKEKSFDFLFHSLGKIDKSIALTIYDYEDQKNDKFCLPPNIRLLLKQPLVEDELRKEICKNDLFIIPSRYDSFPLSLLEAMDTGILFISTNRVGFTERFPEPFKLFLIPFGDAEKLKNKILFLHNMDLKEKNKLSDEIRKFTGAYNWDRISNDYIQLYDELLYRK